MKTNSFLYLIFILFCSCTVKEVVGPLYPPITNTGAMAIAYKANGEQIYAGPYGYGDTGGVPYEGISINNDSLSINLASRLVGTQENAILNITVINFTGKGNYLLGGISKNSAQFDFPNLPPYTNYTSDSTRTGLFSVTTFDTQKKIVSGMFYFNAKNTYSGDLISITDGQFDFKY